MTGKVDVSTILR